MKKYFREDFPSVFYVGKTEEIKRIYRSIRNAILRENTDMMLLFPGMPVFNPNKATYAISIELNRFVSVVNSDTMLSLIVSGDVQEVKA